LRVNEWDFAHPYPSRITVSGSREMTTNVSVDLLGVSHGNPHDLDVMLVSPTGENAVVMSDTGGFEPVTGIDLRLSDAAASGLPEYGPLTSGTYRPGDANGGFDLWQYPAPTTWGDTALATFNGRDPNGAWQLFIMDDTPDNGGSIAGGWCLTIDADDPGSTTTALSAAPNPALPGDDVTFTATVTSAGSPVTDGTVTFTEGETLIGQAMLDDDGHAVFTTNRLTARSHEITASFDATGTLRSSSGTARRSPCPTAPPPCATRHRSPSPTRAVAPPMWRSSCAGSTTTRPRTSTSFSSARPATTWC
jgi:hypothetical protein